MAFLAEIKQKPEEERAAIAMFGAVGVVVLLLVVWIVAFVVSDKPLAENPELGKQAAAAIDGFDNAINQASDNLNQVKTKYKELQGKSNSVGSAMFDAGVSTTTIDEAAKNFVRIYYDENGDAQVDNSVKDPSLLEDR